MIQEYEIWVTIIGYDGYYEVSNMGRIRSCDRIVEHGTGPKFWKSRLLKPVADTHGYLFVILCKEKTRKHMLVHRIVANHFIPNPENKPTVNHKWGHKTDNRSSQLEWATFLEQTQHSYKTGLQKRLLTNEQVQSIRSQKKAGITVVEIAKQFPGTYGNIVQVASNKTYKTV